MSYVNRTLKELREHLPCIILAVHSGNIYIRMGVGGGHRVARTRGDCDHVSE